MSARGHGGRRPGAGRKPGSKGVLPHGSVSAIKTTGLRIPPGTDAGHVALADYAVERMADVLKGDVKGMDAINVLNAAKAIRLEVCGNPSQKVEHSGPDGGALQVVIHKLPNEED